MKGQPLIGPVRSWTLEMMKGHRTVRTLGALLGVLLACSPAYGPKDLIGTWEGASRQMSAVVVTFGADGSWRFEYVDPKGELHSLTGEFEVDFSKAPVPLTIRNIPELPHPLHTIIRFGGADSLVMGGFAPRWRLRPIAFDPATQILLKRQPEGARQTP